MPKILYLVSEGWYFLSHRLPTVQAARHAGFDVVVATNAGDDADKIRALGIEVIDLGSMRENRGLCGRIGFLWRLISTLKTVRPALLHNISLEMSILGSFAAIFAGRMTVLNTVAGLGWAAGSAARQAILIALLLFFRMVWFRQADWIVQNDDDLAFLKRFLPQKRVCLVEGSGVDTARFAPSDKKRSIGQPVLAVLVARMLKSKGVPEFIAAAYDIKASHPSCRLVLVGAPDGTNADSLSEQELNALNASGIVEWWGPRSDMPEVLRQADIAVLPSHREGLPKSLLEAASCGLPIVTTDVPGCRQLVEHNQTGLLVPVRDPKALAQAIRSLLDDPALCRSLGDNARRMIEKRFSAEAVARKMGQIYNRLASVQGLSCGSPTNGVQVLEKEQARE